MNAASDPIIAALDQVVARSAVATMVRECLARVLRQLEGSPGPMAWETIPLSAFGSSLPESIRSCWIFVIRAGAATGAERHPNSHQRSLSLTGTGRFELQERDSWASHPLVSSERGAAEQRWVTIPPSTWHRLFVDTQAWGMLSFHTVAPEELIEERPVDPAKLEGETHQERYMESADLALRSRVDERISALRVGDLENEVGAALRNPSERPESCAEPRAIEKRVER